MGVEVLICPERKQVYNESPRALESDSSSSPALLDPSCKTMGQVTCLLWASVSFPVEWGQHISQRDRQLGEGTMKVGFLV